VSNPLSPDQWQQLESLVDALLDTPPERRAALFAEVSGGDPIRRAELERLVAECERTYPLLDQPATERFAALVDTSPLQHAHVVAERYRIIREIGRGGMATVYLAHDLKHARDVALKVVRAELVATVGSGRFLREIEIAAQLRHPHIVPLYDSGEADGVLYYVMPFEAGQSLRERLRRDGPLPIDDTLVILRDICDALGHAHQRGIVHRDIKPDNVLLSGRHALVTDFGVARAATEANGTATTTGAGVMLGTPAYMAPEQVATDPRVDHRADVYAVGVLAYELLTGHPPFSGDSPQEILAAQLTRVPEPLTTSRPDVPNALAELVMKCLQKKPANRCQSADEIVVALETAARPITPTARSTTPPAPHGKRHRRVRLTTLLGAVAAVAALGLARVMRNRDVPIEPSAPRLAIGILPVRAATPDGNLDWLATGLQSQLSVELAQVSSFDVRPTETIDALTRVGWPLDSVALARGVDYFVRAALSKTGNDSVLVTLELIERGIRSVGAGFVRAPLQLEATVETLGRRLAERLRPMLGSRAREQELERGATDSLALQLRRRADHRRLIARERIASADLEGAERALDSAATLLIASERLDPKWPAPRHARASLSATRALVLLQKSNGADTAGVRRTFDAALALLDSGLKQSPRDAIAFALRGRLRWQRAVFLAPSVRDREADAEARSAQRDLEAALAIDTTLARAAADLSHIYYEAYGRYDAAAAYAERADRLDSYMEESSQIIDRLALSNLEMNRDAAAARWCHEGVRRFPTNPAHVACVLEVMAWGSEPVSADSAWPYFRQLERLTSVGNVHARAFYAMEVAAVLAKSRTVSPDSVRAVVARVYADVAASPAASDDLRQDLLALEAAVLYRLGDATRATARLAELRDRNARKAGIMTQRRMLRDYVRSTAPRRS
jgi:serine/threonine-protein kinase